MRTVLAILLIGGGGWIMYAIINGLPLIPGTQGSDTFGSSTKGKQPNTTSNPPGQQNSRFGPYPA